MSYHQSTIPVKELNLRTVFRKLGNFQRSRLRFPGIKISKKHRTDDIT